MGKEEFVSILSRKGYISKIENGVVIVYAHNSSNDKEMKAFLTEVKNLVKETGYGGSYGVKCKNTEAPTMEAPAAEKICEDLEEDEMEATAEDAFGQLSFI